MTSLADRDFRDYYLVKKSGLDKIRAMIADPNEVVKAVLDVEYALNTVEKELATHQGVKNLGLFKGNVTE
ncbi:hypothetical protein JTE90_001025 [Oedothorax gibbosus]|uniref:Uncharacterized protein n=1 Tax=Oedothorax gibbosus TaxID=931172 RepID=A0AAV6TPJ9_9ARAC|nr:hypothetical protein JTE90_001025 [Oedothorax gibbosus]